MTTLKESRETQDKNLVLQAMENAKGNISRAAIELGISRPTLYQLLTRYGVRKPTSVAKSQTVKVCDRENSRSGPPA